MTQPPNDEPQPPEPPGSDEPTDAGPPMPNPILPQQEAALLRRYWRSNVTIMLVLLAIWAAAGLGCGVLFADWLNARGSIGGFPLGFWFAQQGSIIVFVLLILAYCILLNRLDKRHHEELEKLHRPGD